MWHSQIDVFTRLHRTRIPIALLVVLSVAISGLSLAVAQRGAQAAPVGGEFSAAGLGNGGYVAPDVSGDGQYTVYADEDDEEFDLAYPFDIKMKDHTGGVQVLQDSSGYQPGTTSGSQLVVSEDGDTVVYQPQFQFEFCGGDPMSTPPDSGSNLAVWKRASGGSITPVDVDSSSTPLDYVSPSQFSVSDDGNLIAMTTVDSNVGGVTESDGDFDVVIRDISGGTTSRVNTTATDRDTTHPTIDDDGEWVAVESTQAFGLSADSAETDADVFVIDASNSANVVRISKPDNSSTQASRGGNAADSVDPFISGNGRFVAYVSEADNIVVDAAAVLVKAPKPGSYKAIELWGVFVHDRDADNDGIFDESGVGDVRTVRLRTGSLVPSEPRLSDDGLTGSSQMRV